MPKIKDRFAAVAQDSKKKGEEFVKRIFIRLLGTILSVFMSGRAHALNLSSICPKCSYYGGMICDLATTSSSYDDGAGVGTTAPCIDSQINTGVARFYDDACVSLLKSWGMCTSADTGFAGGAVYPLYVSGLSCTSGAVNSYVNATLLHSGACGYVTYSYADYESGMLRLTGDLSHTACCIVGYDGNSFGNCCVLDYGSSCDLWNSGVCNGEIVSDAVLSGVSTGVVAACSYDFQDYFGGSNNNTSGWCDGDCGIYVEATGALLIANACYGDTGIDSNHINDVFCGVFISSCRGDKGYYHTGQEANPSDFKYYGVTKFCDACPKEENNNLGLDGTGFLNVYANTSGTGIASCYGSAIKASIDVTDNAGKYTITITGDCPYLE